jgi:HEAT repeat protein
MGTILFFVLLGIVILLVVFAFYMLVRILKVFAKARRLETMRGYETILYAALHKLTPEQALKTLITDPDPKALEEVLLRMGDEGEKEWKLKVVELYGLAGFTTTRTRQLHSRFKSKRSDAARRLGRIGDPEVVPELAQLLRDPEEEVREAALFALGRIGTKEALEYMFGALGSGDRWSQEKVAEAIEEAGDESRQVLAGLLKDESPLRRAFAAEVLGGVGGEEEAARLVEALQDGEKDVRARAADSLGRMRSRRARPALLSALEDPAWEVRAQAVKALGRIGEEEDAPSLALALRDSEWWVRGNAASALREMGESGEAPLIEMLWDEDRFAREAAAQALEEGSIVERLVKDIREDDEHADSGRTVRRLAEIGSVGTIVQVLSDLSDREIKAKLVKLLSDIDNPELEKALTRAVVELSAPGSRDEEGGEGGRKDVPPPDGKLGA